MQDQALDANEQTRLEVFDANQKVFAHLQKQATIRFGILFIFCFAVLTVCVIFPSELASTVAIGALVFSMFFGMYILFTANKNDQEENEQQRALN